MKKFFAKGEDEEWVFKMFTIMVYEMVIFPKFSNHIEVTIMDFVEQVEHQVNHVSIIVAETISSLIFCWKKRQRTVQQVGSAFVHFD